MAKKKIKRENSKKLVAQKAWVSGKESLEIYSQMNDLKKQLVEVQAKADNLNTRLEDSEIHINILTRFVTAVCIEKIGMRVGVLKRLLKRVESEAVRDSQILHLESIYKLSKDSGKHESPKPPSKKDPWDDIS